ncbi:unnamed protein product [Amoebophrya sp. A25]|nr:unnamed protein product [Amoebophrya sp. A25]|eukprot:GSA25T00022595001.1
MCAGYLHFLNSTTWKNKKVDDQLRIPNYLSMHCFLCLLKCLNNQSNFHSHRENEVAYVKFKTPESAELAMKAMTCGQLQMHGVALQGRYRMTLPPKTDPDKNKTDDRSQYGAGRFTDSRALMASLRDRGRDRSRTRRSRDRSRERRKRSRNRSRRRDGSSSRSRSRGRRSRRDDSKRTDSKKSSVEEEIVVGYYFGDNQSLGLKLAKDCSVIELEDPMADAFGWRVGDRVVSINGDSVASISEMVTRMKEIKTSGALPVIFKVERDGGVMEGGSEHSSKHHAIEGMNAVRDLISQNSVP